MLRRLSLAIYLLCKIMHYAIVYWGTNSDCFIRTFYLLNVSIIKRDGMTVEFEVDPG